MEGIKYFFDLLEIKPWWLILIVALSFVSCLLPYEPIGKIKETKDKDGKKEYIIFRYKNK